MKFLIGSSYYEKGKGGVEFRREFALQWYYNTMKATPAPSRVVVVSEGGSQAPQFTGMDVVHLSGDLGHCHDLIENRKPHEFSSWSASMLATALLAYDDEADFIYKESDCLAFGPWVERMYQDLGDGVMVFGAKHKSTPFMPCSQSLFLVRHSFIPVFVASYLALGGERNRHNLGEHKFIRIAEKFGHQKCRRLSFGVDRERPLPWDAPVWYFQQPTQAEIDEAKTRGLL